MGDWEEVLAAADPLSAENLRRKAELIADVMETLRRYVVMSPPKLLVVAVWIVHTHCIQSAEQTPYLAITSPEKQCGKSRLLDLLELLAARAWLTVLPSDAVVYRYVNQKQPTMLLDEIDAIFNPRTADRYEGLRALLNSGHRRGAKVPRCVGATNKIVEFSTFCPKALAGIGSLPDTVADRSLPIRLERRTREEPVEKFLRHEAQPDAEELHNRISEWAEQNRDALAGEHPEMPDELSDRMQEGCEVLVAIADRLGCGEELRSALVALLCADRLDDRESLRLRLLRDVKSAFDAEGTRRLSTARLLARLNADAEAPWGTYYGRGMDAHDFSKLLAPYGIKSTTVNLGKGKPRAKGYKREDFYQVWERYA